MGDHPQLQPASPGDDLQPGIASCHHGVFLHQNLCFWMTGACPAKSCLQQSVCIDTVSAAKTQAVTDLLVNNLAA